LEFYFLACFPIFVHFKALFAKAPSLLAIKRQVQAKMLTVTIIFITRICTWKEKVGGVVNVRLKKKWIRFLKGKNSPKNTMPSIELRFLFS